MMVPKTLHSLLQDVPQLPTLDEIAAATRSETGPHLRDIIWENNVPRWHRTGKLCVPEAHRELVLWWFDASSFGGHLGVNRTVRRLNRHFSWPGLPKDTAKFISQCVLCNCLRPITTAPGTAKALDKPTLFSLVSLDFIGPLRFHNNVSCFIHVALDHCSRFMVTAVEASTPTAYPLHGISLATPLRSSSRSPRRQRHPIYRRRIFYLGQQNRPMPINSYVAPLSARQLQ